MADDPSSKSDPSDEKLQAPKSDASADISQVQKCIVYIRADDLRCGMMLYGRTGRQVGYNDELPLPTAYKDGWETVTKVTYQDQRYTRAGTDLEIQVANHSCYLMSRFDVVAVVGHK
jgi:hypothetical protein